MEFLKLTIAEALHMVVPVRENDPHAIDKKSEQVAAMIKYELLSRNYRGVILFLTSGNDNKIDRIARGYLLYVLWQDLESFIIWQHGRDPASEPPPRPQFPQDNFADAFWTQNLDDWQYPELNMNG